MKDDNSIAIGIDIGGSHISAGIVDLSAKKMIEDSIVRQLVNSGGAAVDIIKSWADVIKRIIQKYGLVSAKTGIAIPGPFNYEEGISLMKENMKFGALYGMNIRSALARETGIKPDLIQFRNDAEAFLEGEMFCGIGQGCLTVGAITLGTGLGSAWHRNGFTEDANLWNSSFLDSTAESYLSTRWFISRYKEITGVELPDVKSLSAIAGFDQNARQVFGEFGANLSFFINELINKEGPEVIVMGGNILRAYHLFELELIKGLGELNSKKVKLSSLGELAALVGGACLWNESKVAV